MYFTIFVIGIVTVVIVMNLVSRKDEQQQCKEVDIIIEGAEAFIDQSDINTLITQKYGKMVGRKMMDLPIHDIEKSLTKLPYVAKASVHEDLDGVLKVDIAQRDVVLRVINKNGRDYYITNNGFKIPSTLKYVPRVLVATGNIDEGFGADVDTVKSKVLRNLVEVSSFIDKDELWKNQVVQLYVNQDKDIEMVPRVGTQQLIIGNADSLNNKFELLKDYYTHILPKVGANAYEKVNVKYAGQIICEKRGNWSFADDSSKTKKNNIL